MTANQINASAVEVNKYNAETDRKYKEALVELEAQANAEKERNDRENEAINAERNKISEEESLWRKDAEANKLALERALGIYQARNDERAVAVKERLSALEEQSVYWNNYYREREIFLKNKEADETAQHNRAMEEINNRINELSAQRTDLEYKFKNKELEYKAHQWDTENFFTYANLGLARKKLNFDMSMRGSEFSLAEKELGLKEREVSTRERATSLEASLTPARKFGIVSESVRDLSTAFTNLLKSTAILW